MLKVPDPTVYCCHSPVKAMLVQEEWIIIGNDRGEIRVIDKSTFKCLAQGVLLDAPILSIQQQLYAVLVQYKDINGTIFLVKIWRTPDGKVEIKAMAKVETMVQSFT